ncbi:MAG: hypothetical protein KAT86_03275 [Candidatus Latescibacteria bacterium]|nr:hypothetical protein [Candidatus Latescibacterota bacterium]
MGCVIIRFFGYRRLGFENMPKVKRDVENLKASKPIRTNDFEFLEYGVALSTFANLGS